MEHGASEHVKEQSHTEVTVKTEVDEAAQSTACRGVQTNTNFTKEEPWLVDIVKSEAALLVKEEVVEDGWRDFVELQCVQGPSTSAIVGGTNVFDSIGDLDNKLDIKEKLGDMDIIPTVFQHMDTPSTTNQRDMSVVKQERTINHDIIDPILCGGVKEEIIEDEWSENEPTSAGPMDIGHDAKIDSSTVMLDTPLTGGGLVLPAGSPTPQDSWMGQPGTCTALHSLHKERLETICRVHLRRLDSFKCDICDAVYVDAHKLLQHLQDLHGPRPRGSLDQHVKSPQISKEGQQCATGAHSQQETLNSKSRLTAHCMKVDVKESNKCMKCDKEFKCKTYLSKHVRRVHSGERYECVVCMKIYTSSGALRKHVKNYHAHKSVGAHSQLYRCDHCPETFNYKRYLTTHCRKVHVKESRKCTKCDKEYKCLTYLLKHIRYAHSGTRFECAVCMKIYKSKAALVMHIESLHAVGPEPRIYGCDYCEKMFTNKHLVRRHTARVHENRSYKCHQCYMNYKCMASLMRHTAKVHSAEPPIYTCDYCKKTFTDKGTLRGHITQVHSSGSYKCHQCNKIYKCKKYLMVHTANVHNAEKHFKKTHNSKEIPDSRPTADDMNAAPSTSTQQHNVDVVKEEPADGELELGPVVFQHMDCNYRPYEGEPQDNLGD